MKCLTDDVIEIQENHFSIPMGQADHLKPPENFPVPQYKYTLSEMSLVWYMYGGNDLRPGKQQYHKYEKLTIVIKHEI